MSAITLGNFTEDDVIEWLGDGEVAKGRPYVDLIRDFDEDDERVRARCRRSRTRR